MKRAVLTEPGQFVLEDRPRPSPGPNEVLVSIADVGICGSDVHYYTHGRIGEYVVEEPLVLGHESAGVVVEVGSAVTDLEVGDRVALEPGVPCRNCEYCRRGRYNLCPGVEFMATPPIDGAFAEYVVWPGDFAYRLPDAVSTAAGTLCEPLSVCLHATARGDVGVGDTVLITGCGPIGMLALEAATVRGASKVYVADVVSAKLERALERGANGAIDVSERDLEAAISDQTDGRGVDVVIEASGAHTAIAATPRVVRRGGTIVLVGLSSRDETPLETNQIVDRELDLVGSMRFRHTYPDAIDLLADGSVDVEGLIDFTASLEELDGAFQRVRDDDEVIKGLISVTDEVV